MAIYVWSPKRLAVPRNDPEVAFTTYGDQRLVATVLLWAEANSLADGCF